MNLLNVLLMAQPENGGSGIGAFLPLILIVLVFYLFFIRPQMKKQKQLRQYRESLKKGDKVITIGGIHGKIVEEQERSFTIEVEEGNRLRVEKSAIAMDGASDQLGEKR
ncbi:MAG: preprotein translocase subunit YajC [Bacteroidales bacterium]